MKQKKIESKLTKAKKRLGKVTAKVSLLESRLEEVKKKDPDQLEAKPSVAEKKDSKTKASIEQKPKATSRPKPPATSPKRKKPTDQ